jgi:glycosyltransferase involved in cell wall biosynthesis
MIVLDLSRLLSRAGRETPTGIDRVELAYAEQLIAADPTARFATTTLSGGLGLVPRATAEAFVAAIGTAWRCSRDIAGDQRKVRRLGWRGRLAALLGGEARLFAARHARAGQPVYVLVSHHHLEKPAIFERLKARSGARFVCLIHDLIPMQFPEYARPGQAENHRRRIETVIRFADALIVNSAVTRDALLPHLARAGRNTPVLVAPLGLDLPNEIGEPEPPRRPYFVYIGTIEAKKNHLLLLNLWRQLATDLGNAAPVLVLIGQRGWEAENVVDMLERCPAVQGSVIEHNTLPDTEMVRLLKDARALLLPSFAEGFGFPLIEAFSVGVPALCSDIPALRETGGAVPEYLDPLDGPGWRAAILDYMAPNSPRRMAQLERLRGWQPPTWEAHFEKVDRLIDEASAAPD